MSINILLIKGFNTNIDDIGLNIYTNFDTYVMNTQYKISYFGYNLTTNIDKVYDDLLIEITSNNYDILMGHSMGCCFLLKYCRENDISNYTRIIFLMPMFQRLKIVSIISRIPCIEYFRFPKCLFIPNKDLFNGGNILNDIWQLIPPKQVFQMYSMSYLIDENELTTFLNSKKNTIVFYALDEKITPMTTNLLNNINKKEIIDGKHVVFFDHKTAVNFFNKLSNYLTKDKIE